MSTNNKNIEHVLNSSKHGGSSVAHMSETRLGYGRQNDNINADNYFIYSKFRSAIVTLKFHS